VEQSDLNSIDTSLKCMSVSRLWRHDISPHRLKLEREWTWVGPISVTGRCKHGALLNIKGIMLIIGVETVPHAPDNCLGR
jgi:hypothetical protein